MSAASPPPSLDKRRRWAKLTLQVALSVLVAGYCAYLLRAIDFGAVARALGNASPWLLAFAGAVNVFEVWLRAAAFSLLLSPVAKVPVGRLFHYSLVGLAATALLPWKLGDLVPISLIRSRERISTATLVTATLLEKCTEAVTLVLLAAPLPFILPVLPSWVSAGVVTLASGGAVLLTMAWLVSRGVGSRWPVVARVVDGVRVVQRPWLMLGTLGLAFIGWIADSFTVWLMLRAAGIHTHWAATVLIELALTLTMVLPSTLGTREVAAVLALRLFGVDDERALAFALLYRTMDVVPTTMIGLLAASSFGGMAIFAAARRGELEPAPEPAPVTEPVLTSSGPGAT